MEECDEPLLCESVSFLQTQSCQGDALEDAERGRSFSPLYNNTSIYYYSQLLQLQMIPYHRHFELFLDLFLI